MTTVQTGKYVACPFSATIEYAEEALRGRADLSVSPAPGVAEHVNLNTKATDDVSDPVRRHEALLLAWQPKHPLFPRFRGALTVRPRSRGSYLRLQGSYDPPMGAAGRVFDALVGRPIAVMTLRRLLRDIGTSVESKWNTFRKEIPQ